MIWWELWRQKSDEVAGQHCPLEESVQGQARHCFNSPDAWKCITGGVSHDREVARKAYLDIE